MHWIPRHGWISRVRWHRRMAVRTHHLGPVVRARCHIALWPLWTLWTMLLRHRWRVRVHGEVAGTRCSAHWREWIPLRLLWREWVVVDRIAEWVLLRHMHQCLSASKAIGITRRSWCYAGRIATMALRWDVPVTRGLWWIVPGRWHAMVAVGIVIVRRHGAQRRLVRRSAV